MPDFDPPFVPEAIHNPDNLRHFMRLKPVARRVTARLGDVALADSRDALLLIEVGRDIYDPVFYFPARDVTDLLTPREGVSLCPLKGRAGYFDLSDAEGAVVADKIAWSYPDPYPFAAALAGHVAFYPAKVRFESAPLSV